MYETTWSCLNKDGYDYAIVRGYMSNGYPDPEAIVSEVHLAYYHTFPSGPSTLLLGVNPNQITLLSTALNL
jgi:hypothetical protein